MMIITIADLDRLPRDVRAHVIDELRQFAEEYGLEVEGAPDRDEGQSQWFPQRADLLTATKKD